MRSVTESGGLSSTLRWLQRSYADRYVGWVLCTQAGSMASKIEVATCGSTKVNFSTGSSCRSSTSRSYVSNSLSMSCVSNIISLSVITTITFITFIILVMYCATCSTCEPTSKNSNLYCGPSFILAFDSVHISFQLSFFAIMVLCLCTTL